MGYVQIMLKGDRFSYCISTYPYAINAKQAIPNGIACNEIF